MLANGWLRYLEQLGIPYRVPDSGCPGYNNEFQFIMIWGCNFRLVTQTKMPKIRRNRMGNHLISRYLRYSPKEVSMFQKEVSKHISAPMDAKKLPLPLALGRFWGFLAKYWSIEGFVYVAFPTLKMDKLCHKNCELLRQWGKTFLWWVLLKLSVCRACSCRQRSFNYYLV